jgi:hypothetical protein
MEAVAWRTEIATVPNHCDFATLPRSVIFAQAQGTCGNGEIHYSLLFCFMVISDDCTYAPRVCLLFRIVLN